jgi:hypothetical protein
MRVPPFLTSVDKRVAQCNEAVRITEGRPSLVERLGVCDDERQLILVENWRPRHFRPEMRWYRQHPAAILRVPVGDVILDFQVQLVDGRLEKCGGGQY